MPLVKSIHYLLFLFMILGTTGALAREPRKPPRGVVPRARTPVTAPAKTSDVRPQASPSSPAPAPAPDRATLAMRRMNASDLLLRDGRLALAYQGYLDLLREFPTWWLPTLKAAVAARALHLPDETVQGHATRAAALQPTGSYLQYVDALFHPGGVNAVPAPPPGDPLADRSALLRARRLEAQGRKGEAATEYRALLARTPGCAQARWRLARLLQSQGQSDEAANLLRDGAGNSLFPPRWRAASEAASGRPRVRNGRD